MLIVSYKLSTENISLKSVHDFLTYSARRQNNRQTDPIRSDRVTFTLTEVLSMEASVNRRPDRIFRRETLRTKSHGPACGCDDGIAVRWRTGNFRDPRTCGAEFGRDGARARVRGLVETAAVGNAAPPLALFGRRRHHCFC